MVKNETPKKNYAWLPDHMPRVARLMREKRAALGDAHINECWRRGVLGLEAGWFFAREGSLALGVPWAEPELANFAAASVSRDQALLMVRPLAATTPKEKTC